MNASTPASRNRFLSPRTLVWHIALFFLLVAAATVYFATNALNALSAGKEASDALQEANRLQAQIGRVVWLCAAPDQRQRGGKNLLTETVATTRRQFGQLDRLRNRLLHGTVKASDGKSGGNQESETLARQGEELLNAAENQNTPSPAPAATPVPALTPVTAAAAPLFESLDMLVSAGRQEVARHTERVRQNVRGLAATFILATVLAYLIFFLPMSRRIRRDAATLHEVSSTDGLTQLLNRRAFGDILESSCALYQRYKAPLSLITFNIDHFKKVNDTYGHDCGDQVLKSIAEIIQKCIRTTDSASRLGGEVFCILCPNTDTDGAKLLADRIRKQMESAETLYSGVPIAVTVSAGVAGCSEDHAAPADLLENADTALTQAKNAGRNRVAVFAPNAPVFQRLSARNR